MSLKVNKFYFTGYTKPFEFLQLVVKIEKANDNLIGPWIDLHNSSHRGLALHGTGRLSQQFIREVTEFKLIVFNYRKYFKEFEDYYV